MRVASCICNPPINIETFGEQPKKSMFCRFHAVMFPGSPGRAMERPSAFPRSDPSDPSPGGLGRALFRRGDNVCRGVLAANGLYGSAQMGQIWGKFNFWFWCFCDCFSFFSEHDPIFFVTWLAAWNIIIYSNAKKNNEFGVITYHQQSPGWKWKWWHLTANDWLHANKNESTNLVLDDLWNLTIP